MREILTIIYRPASLIYKISYFYIVFSCLMIIFATIQLANKNNHNENVSIMFISSFNIFIMIVIIIGINYLISTVKNYIDLSEHNSETSNSINVNLI